MLTANAIQRVFYLRYGPRLGTAFAVEHGDREYLVTAKHVVRELETGQSVSLMHNGAWVEKPVRLVGHCDVDISVFAIDQRLVGKNLSLPLGSRSLVYGQDVYFLGFPYGLWGNVPANNGYPFPFAKKAALASMDSRESPYFLDGINNEGFSGGPVIFKTRGSDEDRCFAVISGFKSAILPIYDADGAPHEELSTRFNTGLISCYDIRFALAAINANPIGVA